jgi:hypothetical protein
MATDARISASLPTHPKTKKLIRKLGQSAGWNLVCLFLWAAANRSDGDLSGLSIEDLEIAADWQGEEGAFVAALVEVRFLDGQDMAYELHDWAEHNPWAAGADMRSAKARWNAAKRHYGPAEANRLVPEYAAVRSGQQETTCATSNAARTATSNPASTDDACTQQDAALLGSIAPSPSPSPSPTPTYKKTISSAKPTADRFPEFWAMWPKSQRKVARAECAKRWAARGLDAQTDQILAHVQAMRLTRQWKDGYEPAPLTYLNQRRWEDGADTVGDSGGWWLSAGFSDRYEAENSGCREHNAGQFSNGKRKEAA